MLPKTVVRNDDANPAGLYWYEFRELYVVIPKL